MPINFLAFCLHFHGLLLKPSNRYLIVDYERQNFSISQSTYSKATKESLVSIPPRGNDTLVIARTAQRPPTSSKMSGGVLAGIIVAILTLIILVCGSIIFLIRRRKSSLAKSKPDETLEKQELDAQTKPVIIELYCPDGEADSREIGELDATTRVEVEGSRGGFEMEGSKGAVEMESNAPAAVELDAGSVIRQELPSPEPTAQIMPSSNVASRRQEKYYIEQ